MWLFIRYFTGALLSFAGMTITTCTGVGVQNVHHLHDGYEADTYRVPCSSISLPMHTIADSSMISNGYEPEKYSLTCGEDDSYYYFKYFPTSPTSLFDSLGLTTTQLLIEKKKLGVMLIPAGATLPLLYYYGVIEIKDLELSRYDLISEDIVDDWAIQLADSVARVHELIALDRTVFESEDAYYYIFGSGPYTQEELINRLVHPMQVVILKKGQHVSRVSY